jgi:hypothetical protein
LDDDTPTKGNGRLKGIPPTTFDGDRSCTIDFLTEFKSFMLMNDDARIAKNPIKRCSYFLSLVKGPNVKGWTKRQLDWLDIVCEDPTELPWHMTAWQVLEHEFRNTFVDYAKHERAQDEIRKLKMNAGNVDQYIAKFQQLADRGNLDVNEPSNLRLFARGLPTRLAETCINLVKPQNFEQWSHAAQDNQKAWLQKQALKTDYGVPQPGGRQKSQNSDQPAFFWRRGGRNNGSRQQGQSGQGSNRSFPPCDPNAMDTSATVRKAITEADKQKHREQGRCFECSKQGHIARNCPDRKARIKVAKADQTAAEPPKTEDDEQSRGEAFAEQALQLSDEARDAFIKRVLMMGDEMGFLGA